MAAIKVKAAKTPVASPEQETQHVSSPGAKSKAPGRDNSKVILPTKASDTASHQVQTAQPRDPKPASGSGNPAVAASAVEPAAALPAKTPSPDRPLPAEGRPNSVPSPVMTVQQSEMKPLSGAGPENRAEEPISAGHGAAPTAHGPSPESPLPPHRESVPVQPQTVTAQQGDATTPPSSSGAPGGNLQETAAAPATMPTETATPPDKAFAGVERHKVATKQPISPEHRISPPAATIETPRREAGTSIPPFREWEPASLKKTDIPQGGVEGPQISSISTQDSPQPAGEPQGAPAASAAVARTAKGAAGVKATVPAQTRGHELYRTTPQLAIIRSGPDVNAPVLQQVPEGTELRAIARDGDWLKLELRDGDVGWIHQRLVKESG